jgi:hypothetical protein
LPGPLFSKYKFKSTGVQNGQLSWDDVGPLMAKYLSPLDMDVSIYIAEENRTYQYDPAVDSKINENQRFCPEI